MNKSAKRLIIFLVVIGSIFLFIKIFSTENYSNGERIGLITKFSDRGLMFKSWEGHLNMTQTGMNTAGNGFDFSIDNDAPDEKLIKRIDSAAQLGWKVKLVYHQTYGKNWFSNRGETNYFISKCEVLDKDITGTHSKIQENSSVPNQKITGKIVDTIYVIIDKRKKK